MDAPFDVTVEHDHLLPSRTKLGSECAILFEYRPLDRKRMRILTERHGPVQVFQQVNEPGLIGRFNPLDYLVWIERGNLRTKLASQPLAEGSRFPHHRVPERLEVSPAFGYNNFKELWLGFVKLASEQVGKRGRNFQGEDL